MTVREVQSPSSASGAREKLGIITVGVLVLGAVGLYLALGTGGGRSESGNLLPYQTLIRSLPTNEQQMYTAIRSALPTLETSRARTSRWPEPIVLAGDGVAPFANGATDKIEWQRFQRGATVTYYGQPADAAAPAWLLTIQEPEPNTPPDPAPLDDEHHRLPDGTTLHIYVWMHRIAGRLTPAFVPQPQNEGWIELFATPPNPVIVVR